MSNKIFSSLIVLALLGVISCNGNRVFEDYSGFESQNWHVDDTVTFDITEIKSHSKALMSVKYNTDYGFRNIYVKYFLSDSLGKHIESQLVNIPLFDSQQGKPLGNGFGSIYTKTDTLPIITNAPYAKVHFVQYMRVEKLNGLEAIGLKLIK